MVELFSSDIGEESDFEWCNVLGGVYWAPWPKGRPRAGGPDKFAMLATAPGEGQCPEDKPGEASRPAEQGGHHQGPEQCPGPPGHRGEGRGTRLPALQPSSAYVVWPVWGLHLGPVQAEPALHQWVAHIPSCFCTKTKVLFFFFFFKNTEIILLLIVAIFTSSRLSTELPETSCHQPKVSKVAVVLRERAASWR